LPSRRDLFFFLLGLSNYVTELISFFSGSPKKKDSRGNGNSVIIIIEAESPLFPPNLEKYVNIEEILDVVAGSSELTNSIQLDTKTDIDSINSISVPEKIMTYINSMLVNL